MGRHIICVMVLDLTAALADNGDGPRPNDCQRSLTREILRNAAMPFDDGRRRVVIREVEPEIDAGRYPIKRTIGEHVAVTERRGDRPEPREAVRRRPADGGPAVARLRGVLGG